MSRHNMISLALLGVAVALSATDAAACGRSREHLSVADKKAKEMQGKAVEGQDMSPTDKALADAKQSTAADADKAKELAAEQARREEAACGSRQPTAAELAAQQSRIEQARRKAEEEATTRRAEEVQLYLDHLERMHALEDEALSARGRR